MALYRYSYIHWLVGDIFLHSYMGYCSNNPLENKDILLHNIVTGFGYFSYDTKHNGTQIYIKHPRFKVNDGRKLPS